MVQIQPPQPKTINKNSRLASSWPALSCDAPSPNRPDDPQTAAKRICQQHLALLWGFLPASLSDPPVQKRSRHGISGKPAPLSVCPSPIQRSHRADGLCREAAIHCLKALKPDQDQPREPNAGIEHLIQHQLLHCQEQSAAWLFRRTMPADAIRVAVGRTPSRCISVNAPG